MERFLARQTIRQRMRIITGQASSDALSGQTFDRHNEFIRLANEEVLSRRQWATTKLETQGTIEIDQQFISYPTNCRAQNVLEVGIWSEGVDTTVGYWMSLKKAKIPLILDTSPISDAGGDPAVAEQGRPTRYEPMDQIQVWKRPEKEYLYKIMHTISPDLAAEADVCVVDAIAIIHLAAEYEFDHLGDPDLAKKQRGQGEKRIALLHGWQHAGEIVAMDDEATFDEQRGPFYNIDTTGRPG